LPTRAEGNREGNRVGYTLVYTSIDHDHTRNDKKEHDGDPRHTRCWVRLTVKPYPTPNPNARVN